MVADLLLKYPQSHLINYIYKCQTEEIIIGHEITQQHDLLLEHFSDPDIRVDFTEANKRIKFIEEKCKHSEAPFAGKPFLLGLFQKAFIESIYIFYIYDQEIYDRHTDDERSKSKELSCDYGWVRKHQDVLLLVARKNGKTPLIAALCLAEFFCGEKGTKALCSSNDYAQADLAFQAINAMREESPALEKVTRKNIKGIFFGNPKNPKRKGKFSYANKGNILKISAKTGAKEGKNIRVGMADEIHEMKDKTPIMPIRQALSTQDNPVYFELTTEGFVNDGYLDERLKEARQVLNRELERPRWLIWLFTQDSEAEVWQNEASWVKSNPGLGFIKKRSFLRSMIEESKTSNSTRAFVMSKDFNFKQNNASAWLMSDDINNTETFNIEDFRGCFAIGSVDLSKSGDLASARVTIMKKGSRKKYTLQKYFIPESKIADLNKDDKEKFLDWIRKDLVTISPGNENDFSLITAWFVGLYKDYGLRIYKVGYDKWSAVYWVKEMEDMGFECIRVDQSFGSMSEPMKLVEADLKGKLLNYGDNPIDRYCLENTALNINSKAEIMPVKIQSKENKKIDGSVTMIIGYRIYIDNRSEFIRLVEGS
ncbi:terminase large subunit [Pelosinus propionicus]|uniref:Phage terminase-like protein, large subunit, contains N-terminal HTH domain n=1 Tax=Pelosinus propionicus DSM 13327 TaxID=1123291 RepID=A0A1I4N206_9FIRM|nr:terminase TerL endonuclease subunit [Pelosinus propionicus]SFM09273.1 Phage terminase-like protein, large subunit, contains N-terminal HTH domain [Pelosinus propionicus DSM 13327]